MFCGFRSRPQVECGGAASEGLEEAREERETERHVVDADVPSSVLPLPAVALVQQLDRPENLLAAAGPALYRAKAKRTQAAG
jgi:hypothetical protein